MDDHEFLLPPRGFVVNEIAMKLAPSVRMAFLEHDKARGPVFQCAVGIRVGQSLLGDNGGFVEIGSRLRHLFPCQGIVFVVDFDIAEYELVT